MAQADSLTGKAALITGSTRNLGLAIAGQLAAAGAGIMLNYHHPARKAEAGQAAAATAAHGTRVLACEADVTTPAGVASLFDATASAFGRVDIVVNNAGVVAKKPIAQTTDDDYDRAFAVNAKAAFLVMREAARRIEDGGRVINIITSIVAFTIPCYGVYAASKGAVEHMTKALAKEIGHRSVTVNCVAPGPMNTSFYYPVEDQASIAGAKSRSIGDRLAETGDVAPLVAFLCTEQGSWITAQTIRVNGGMA